MMVGYLSTAGKCAADDGRSGVDYINKTIYNFEEVVEPVFSPTPTFNQGLPSKF